MRDMRKVERVRLKRKTRGRPRLGATGVLVKILPDQLAALDTWIKAQEGRLSRPEAIRRLIDRGLGRKGP
jgi:hypothetical protein